MRERLARRLAETTTATTPPSAVLPPEVASLPRAEATEPPKVAALSPAQVPVPSGGLVVPLESFPYAWYLALLKEQVYSRWSPPSGFFLGTRAAVALVSFRIDRAGRLSRVAIKESSGFARFDQSALAAVRSLAQVPTLPTQYPEETLDVVIRFQNVQ